MAFFHAFFDESGKAKGGHPVVSFCGFMCSGEGWMDFIHEWNYLLRRYRIPALHLAKDPFKASPKQLQMYQQFVRVIRENVECGFGMAIDVASFNKMHRAAKAALNDDPQFLAFSSVVSEIIRYASNSADPTVAIACDEDEDKACETYRLWRRARQQNADYRKILKSIAFADDTHFPQLQAADLFSWVVRAEAAQRFMGVSYALGSLYSEFDLGTASKRITYPKVGFWGDDELEQLSRLSIKSKRGMR